MPLYTESLVKTADMILDAIAKATQLTPGNNLSQLYMPAQVPAASLNISGGQPDQLAGCAVTSLRMTATIDGRFAELADAQRFALEVCGIFPLRNTAPIESFHLTSPPTFEARMETLANQGADSLFYRVSIPAEVAFTVATS